MQPTGDTCYFRLFDNPVHFDEAYAFCRDMNTDVASIYSRAENSVINSLRDGGFENGIWLGGQRINQNDFGWVNAKGGIAPMTYTNYITGEPNNFKNEENCIAMGHKVLKPDDKWNDAKCWANKPFVCKFCIEAVLAPPTTSTSTSSSSTSETTSSTSTSTSTSTSSSSTTTSAESTTSSEPIGLPQPGKLELSVTVVRRYFRVTKTR